MQLMNKWFRFVCQKTEIILCFNIVTVTFPEFPSQDDCQHCGFIHPHDSAMERVDRDLNIKEFSANIRHYSINLQFIVQSLIFSSLSVTSVLSHHVFVLSYSVLKPDTRLNYLAI